MHKLKLMATLLAIVPCNAQDIEQPSSNDYMYTRKDGMVNMPVHIMVFDSELNENYPNIVRIKPQAISNVEPHTPKRRKDDK